MERIRISEQFISIQGEGMSQGRPVKFIRLTGCNLDCPWCDTTEVWKRGDWFNIDDVKAYPRIVITGGEPMLQQNKIEAMIRYWDDRVDYPIIIEIETNGTIMPSLYLMKRIQQWNCSPKLRNSEEIYNDRFKFSVLEQLVKLNSQFKFVIDNEGDLDEVNEMYPFIPSDQIWLMPMASDRDTLIKKSEDVARWAINYEYNFSNRLQVQIWNKTTGV